MCTCGGFQLKKIKRKTTLLSKQINRCDSLSMEFAITRIPVLQQTKASRRLPASRTATQSSSPCLKHTPKVTHKDKRTHSTHNNILSTTHNMKPLIHDYKDGKISEQKRINLDAKKDTCTRESPRTSSGTENKKDEEVIKSKRSTEEVTCMFLPFLTPRFLSLFTRRFQVTS